MKIVGLMLARNEAWVIGCSARAALAWCEELVVLNHASTDDTQAIIESLPRDRVTWDVWLNAETWDEMDARRHSLGLARKRGATHVAIVDADEVLSATCTSAVRDWFAQLKPGQCLDVQMIVPWKSLDRYRVEPSIWTKARITLGFADSPDLSWEPRGPERYQHHARSPMGCRQDRVAAPVTLHAGGVMHLQWASWPRLIAKHRAYKMMERVRWPQYAISDINERYDKAPCEAGVIVAPIPSRWWEGYRRDLIRLDHHPWYVDECERLLRQYGSETFRGLDLFGWPQGATAAGD